MPDLPTILCPLVQHFYKDLNYVDFYMAQPQSLSGVTSRPGFQSRLTGDQIDQVVR